MAVLFTLLCSAAVFVLGYFHNYFARGHFIESTEQVIDTEIKFLQTLPAGSLIKTSDDRLYVFFKEGERPKDIPPGVSPLSEGILEFYHPGRDRTYAAKIHTFRSGYKVLLGVDITGTQKQFRFLQTLSLLSIIFMLLIIGLSFFISIFVVRRTNHIARTAREIIDTGDLSRRVDIGSRWDDLSHAGAVLNVLLERIEGLMQGVRQVSDNIAHDLKMPLTRMRNRLENMHKNSKDKKNMKALMNDVDGILDTFNALLRISRLETEQRRDRFEKISLRRLLEDVVEFYEPVAEQKNISIQVSLEEVTFTGDKNLLFQAYANILDNAIKYTPEGGSIALLLTTLDGKIQVSITDSGAGVEESEKEQIFKRFYRCQKSRTAPGSGLGLSVVAAVIDLHGGRIEVENMNPGLQVMTEF